MMPDIQVNDRIVIINPVRSFDDYGLGDTAVVTGIDVHGVDVKWERLLPLGHDDQRVKYVTHEEYERIEPEFTRSEKIAFALILLFSGVFVVAVGTSIYILAINWSQT